MRTIYFMSGVSDPPDIIILCTTHPTPFLSTPKRTSRTLYVITSIHLLNPTSAVARPGIGLKPGTGGFVSSKLGTA